MYISSMACCESTAQGRAENWGSSPVRPTAEPARAGITGCRAFTSFPDTATEW